MPQICILNEFFPPDYAATGQLIEELAKELSKYELDIEVFTGQPGYAFSSSAARREKLEEILVRRTRSTGLWPRRIRGKTINGISFFVRAFLHILRHQRKLNLIVVTTAPPFLTILGYLSQRLFKLPYICVIYDLYPNIITSLKVIPEKHWLVELWDKANYQTWLNAKSIVVLTSSMKQRITSTYPEFKDKIIVIHNWADGEKLVPIEKQNNLFAQKHHLVDKFTVLYSGNIGRCHDMTTLIEAAKYLRDKPIQFVIIGNGAKYPFLINEVNRLKFNNFIFLPYQDKETLPSSLTACDLSLVSMAKEMEGLVAPSKLYSCLAVGRPIAVICPEGSFLKDLVIDAKCGESFRNGDGYGLAQFILKLSQDSHLSQNMGKAAREYFYSHFTRRIAVSKYFDVIQKSLSLKQNYQTQSNSQLPK